MIEWQSFSWEAFATLFTGLAAVAGAVTIGLKQTKIQQSQHLISETTVRIALFERRSACIARMRHIHNTWMQNARLTREEWREFRELFHESELIFSKQLGVEIDQSLDGLFWTEHWRVRSLQEHERGKTDKADDHLRQSFDEDDKVFSLMPNLLKKMKEEARVADWS